MYYCFMCISLSLSPSLPRSLIIDLIAAWLLPGHAGVIRGRIRYTAR